MDCAGCEKTYLEIQSGVFKNDLKAIEIFQEHGVLPTQQDCEKCGTPCTLRRDRNTFQCNKRIKLKKQGREVRCTYQRALFKDSWLSGVKLCPSTNLCFINIFLRKYFSYSYCSQNLGLSEETITDWKNFCGEVCMRWLNSREPIGGPGKIVEIDESKFGKRKNNQGRIVEGSWIFGGIERETKQCFAVRVEARDAATLIPLCLQYIKPGTTVYSDCWKAYSSLSDHGFLHQTVNHAENFVDPATGVHTNTIERCWRDIKSWVLRSGIRKYHYERYLARYMFQKSHPDHRTIFHYFLKEIARAFPPPQF